MLAPSRAIVHPRFASHIRRKVTLMGDAPAAARR
jgi:hypothetical protein